MAFCIFVFFVLILGSCTHPKPPGDVSALPQTTDASQDDPPPAPREFRAAWVATVSNIDWPSRPGLPVEQQQAEIVKIVARAKELNLNALVLQVRPSADALYPSALEPWSEFLTGMQGKAPLPFYDPLQMWIDEAHRNGIELHAWFNPYRARHSSALSPVSATHIAASQPGLVKSYGTSLWMDPGEPAAAQRTLDVILDVVRRYDIDGVHIDDYFYPYPIPLTPSPSTPALATTAVAEPPELDFPDESSWGKYLLAGGTLSRADWRRQNVNNLIERIYHGIRREKPFVKFGISPFGLGRPDRRPPGINGFSQYDKLYADVELWLNKGWLDYLAPQLYWPIDPPAQAFPVLLEYWNRENTPRRHMWPGLYTSRIDGSAKSWKPEEIVNQIALTRSAPQETARGHLHFSMAALMEDRQGIGTQLKAGPYATPALVPATPWLNNIAPDAPQVIPVITTLHSRVKSTLLNFDKSVWHYAIWVRYGTTWQFFLARAPLNNLNEFVANDAANALVISAVDRWGNESKRVRVPIHIHGNPKKALQTP